MALDDRVLNVGAGAAMYPTIHDALADVPNLSPPLSGSARAQILVHPGYYTSTTEYEVPSQLSIRGVDKFSVRLFNETTNMFKFMGPSAHIGHFLIEGSSNTALTAFDGNGQSRLHIRDVDMLNNGGQSKQQFLRQEGTDWFTLIAERCIIDSFREGGAALIRLVNTAVAARYVDAYFCDIFTDVWHTSNYLTQFQVSNCQDVRLHDCKVRGNGPWHTGVRVERPAGKTGQPWAHLFNSHLTGGVPVYAEAGCHYELDNCSARGSLTAGSRQVRNSAVI